MSHKCQLSNNTQTYLERYQEILCEMIKQMTSVVPTDSVSGSFIEQMIPHHRAAIEMSKNLLQYTTNVPLQNIALNIISSQEESIQQMLMSEPDCQTLPNTPVSLACYQRENSRILQTMFREMSSACADNNIDANFMREMIPHHRGAVQMSENALCNPLCPRLVPILSAIITSQKKGIREMQCLLRKIECGNR